MGKPSSPSARHMPTRCNYRSLYGATTVVEKSLWTLDTSEPYRDVFLGHGPIDYILRPPSRGRKQSLSSSENDGPNKQPRLNEATNIATTGTGEAKNNTDMSEEVLVAATDDEPAHDHDHEDADGKNPYSNQAKESDSLASEAKTSKTVS